MLSIGNAFQGLPSLCTNAYLSTSCSACSISALISQKSYKAAPNCISRADSSSACLRRVSPGVQHYIPKVSKKQYRGGSKEAEATQQRMARAGRTCRSRLGFFLKEEMQEGSPLFTFHAYLPAEASYGFASFVIHVDWNSLSLGHGIQF